MFDSTHDFFRCLHNARVATRRQDFAAADKWMKLAERHLKMMERFLIVEKRRRDVYGYVNPG